MWLLQRKNLHKKHLLWLKIVGLCFGLHLIVLFWVFCIYRENNYMHCFAVNKKIDYSIPILFLPAVAKAMADKPAAEQPKLIVPKKAATASSQKLTTTLATLEKPNIIKPVPLKAVTPEKPKTVAVTSQKVDEKKIVEPVKKAAPIEPAKSVVPDKPPVKEKEITAEKKIESDFAKASSDTSSDTSSGTAKKETSPGKQPINAHVSNNYREVEAMRRGAQLQKELVQQWHPPIGVSPDCACDISFFVDKQGTIQNLKMVKSSNIIMFDISARQALFAMKMPQWTYGKPLIISFK